MSPPKNTTKATAEQHASSTVHRLGDAEITQTQQGSTTVFSVSGRWSQPIMELLEKVLLRARGDVGLDLRALRGPPQAVVPYLRKVNRHYKAQGRVFLLYQPPSQIVDQLRLMGTEDEFNFFTNNEGLVTSKSAAVAKERAVEPAAPPGAEMPARTIVTFTQNLERARQLETSLETAGRRSLLMGRSPVPRFEPFDIATVYHPHDKLGGDFLRLLLLDEDRLGVAMGDVSGHGLEAALIMGMTKKVMEIRATEGSRDDPRAVMLEVNQDIFNDLDHYTFVTGIYGILDRRSGSFTYCRAGHNYPLLVSRARGAIESLNASGMALGMDCGDLFQSTLVNATQTVGRGDVLVIYTDGLTEAAHSKRGQFGVERLAQFFREANLDRPTEQIQAALLQQVSEFLEGEPLKDDLSLILIRHAGAAAG